MICGYCGKKLIQKHFNQKFHPACARKVRSKNLFIPPHATKKQISDVKKYAGKIDRKLLPKKIGLSIASIKRIGNVFGLSFATRTYSQETKDAVCRYYEKNGKRKTKLRFPGVCVRSIVERYPHERRQSRWNDDEFVELAKMAGIIPFENQWKYFNRPLAYGGSIKSVWVKRFKNAATSINGLFRNKALYITKESCPFLENKKTGQKFYLWIDIEKHLKADTMKTAVKIGANFQRWLWGGGNVKNKINQMIKKRML